MKHRFNTGKNYSVFAWAFSFLASFCFVANAAGILDTLTLGDVASEAGHGFTDQRSEKITGGLGESARRLLAPPTTNWEGGHMAFTMGVDPAKQNYVTVRLWGSDVTRDQLILFCAGRQIGYRHLGDIDIIDIGGDAAEFSDRFTYRTTPLPLELTRGKTNQLFEIRCIGPTFAYASEFDQYQKMMTAPTRGIYNLYTHTDGAFVPPAGEQLGVAVAHPPARTGPGAEVLVALKVRVNDELTRQLNATSPLLQMQMQMLARAYQTKWTVAYHNPQAVAQIVKSLDAIFVAYRKNPKLAEAEPTTWNPDWFGLGPSGDVIRLLAEELRPLLDAEIDDGAGKKIPRRAAFSEMLVACRDWHRQHRRLYTNQSMINDLYGIYLANRGVAVVDSAHALPEKQIRRYLYESVGLEPWRDSDPAAGAPGQAIGDWKVGTNYWELTAKGLTKELGYVGYYGEVLDWLTAIYDATRPALGQPGDEKIRAQLIRAAHARSNFRYPALDAQGYRTMRIEAVVGWRDGGHYPGDIAYAERASWDGSPLGWVAATLDADGLGFVQQMLADGQFYSAMKEHLNQGGLRVTCGLLCVPEQFELIQSQPPQTRRLPMTPGQPDFVFSDEENGVVAIKNGEEIFYASLYWRARNAVNFLARVHLTTPTMDRIAVVGEEVEFEPNGNFYTRPDHINFGFANGGPRYPNAPHSAHAGEKLPIAKIPAGVNFKLGDESVFAGKGDFYTLRYGNYLIGMNLTINKTFELKTPPEISEAKELASGKNLKLAASLKVAPRSTVVLWFGKERK